MDFLINVLIQEKPSEFIKKNEDKIFELIPELKNCVGFNQNNMWHVYDVYEHILHVVDKVPNNLILRLAALFHDIGKPLVYEEDKLGIGHFYGHWDKSNEIFLEFATRNNLEENIKYIVSNLILYHDLSIEKLEDEELKKLLTIFDKNGIIMLYQLKRSDLLAQNKKFHFMLDDYEQEKNKILKSMK